MKRIEAMSCFAILEGFDMSCLPELRVSRQYDDLLTTRPFELLFRQSPLKLSVISGYMKFDIFL